MLWYPYEAFDGKRYHQSRDNTAHYNGETGGIPEVWQIIDNHVARFAVEYNAKQDEGNPEYPA